MRKGEKDQRIVDLERYYDQAPKVRGKSDGSPAHILLDNIVRTDTKVSVQKLDEDPNQLKMF